MKKIFYLLTLVLALGLSSCQKDNLAPGQDLQQTLDTNAPGKLVVSVYMPGITRTAEPGSCEAGHSGRPPLANAAVSLYRTASQQGDESNLVASGQTDLAGQTAFDALAFEEHYLRVTSIYGEKTLTVRTPKATTTSIIVEF